MLAEHFGAGVEDLDWKPRWNIAPTQPVPVTRYDRCREVGGAVVCEKQGIHWEELGLPNDAPTFGDTLFDPPLPADLDTVCLIPPPESILEFVAGRTPEAKAWGKVTDQNSTLVVGRYRSDHHIKREDHMFAQIQSQLASHDRVLAIVGAAHMGSLLRKCKDANLNVEGFSFYILRRVQREASEEVEIKITGWRLTFPEKSKSESAFRL